MCTFATIYTYRISLSGKAEVGRQVYVSLTNKMSTMLDCSRYLIIKTWNGNLPADSIRLSSQPPVSRSESPDIW